LLAAGVQATSEDADYLSIAEVELKYRNKNDADGMILDLQFEGGARTGYSGGPVVIEEGGSLVCVGIIRLGNNGAFISNAIGLGAIRVFVAEYLPAASLQQRDPDRRTNPVGWFRRRGILLLRVLVAAACLTGVLIGAKAGRKYLASHHQTNAVDTASVFAGSAAPLAPPAAGEVPRPEELGTLI